MENRLNYTQVGDYLIPNLTLADQPSRALGKYGLLRKDFLREHRPILWGTLILNGELYRHLLEIEDAANSRLEALLPALARTAGATEELKACDPLRWAGLMNTCKAQAEEVILSELVYS